MQADAFCKRSPMAPFNSADPMVINCHASLYLSLSRDSLDQHLYFVNKASFSTRTPLADASGTSRQPTIRRHLLPSDPREDWSLHARPNLLRLIPVEIRLLSLDD